MTLSTNISLPVPPSGWFDYGYSVLLDGKLALVRTDIDVKTEFKRWRDKALGGNYQAPGPNLSHMRLRLSKSDASDEIGVIEIPAGRGGIKVNCLADGRWLVAWARAAPDEHNARLFAADGTPVGAFALGDGIKHLLCAPDGTIWVGYFDEGVFSGPNRDGSPPVSASGVAQFGPDGRVLWRFNDEKRGDPFIVDCYALTLDGNTLWCCPYENFPIIRVKNGVVNHWPNAVAGAKAMAVEDDDIVLAGGYNDTVLGDGYSDKSDRIALLRLDRDQAQQVGEGSFQPRGLNTASLLQGQGPMLHIVRQGSWTKLSLASFRQTLKP